jgi:hypothetical protein
MLQLTKITQHFPRPHLADPPATLAAQIPLLAPHIHPGARIGLAVGSRGITGLEGLVTAAVSGLKNLGAEPFIIPAMGSHGGATAEGQIQVLASYGITPERVGAPVLSSMDTVQIEAPGHPTAVYLDRHAWDSDGVVVINRIKPHTDYHGPYESGLAKICVIGLGKHRQALAIHSHGVYGLRHLIPPTAERLLASGKIIGGIGLVENAYDETMALEVLPADRIMQREPELLDMARSHMPSLPIEDIDVLIVDRIGKDISGVGMDPNIIGRTRIRDEAEPDAPRIKAIIACGLTPASHGNALGVGLADVITQPLFDAIDRDTTYENIVTSTFLERGKIPPVAPTAAVAYEWAHRSCGVIEAGTERVLRIRDTLHLSQIHVSAAIAAELKSDAPAAATTAVFDSDGGLKSF